MDVDVADFAPRRSRPVAARDGAKRSSEKTDRLKYPLYEGMARNGIIGDLAVTIFLRLKAFSNYGVPVHSLNRCLSGLRSSTVPIEVGAGSLRLSAFGWHRSAAEDHVARPQEASRGQLLAQRHRYTKSGCGLGT